MEEPDEDSTSTVLKTCCDNAMVSSDTSFMDGDATAPPRASLDRLYISVPQAPHAFSLPGPPTFGSMLLNDDPNSPSSDIMNNRRKVQFRDARVVSLIAPGSSMTTEERNELWYPTKDLDGFKVQARTLSRQLREPAINAVAGQGIISSPENEESNASSTTSYPCIMGHQQEIRIPGFPSSSSINITEGSLSPPTLPPPPQQSACVSRSEVDVEPSNNNADDNNNNNRSSSGCISMEANNDGQADARGLEHRVCLNRQRNKHLAIRCILKAQGRSRCPDFIARISSKCTEWAKELAVREADRDYCEAYCPQKLAGNPKILQNQCPFAATMIRQFKRCHSGGQASTTTTEAVAPSTAAKAIAVAPQIEGQLQTTDLLPTSSLPTPISFPVVASGAPTTDCLPPSAKCNGAVDHEQQQQQQKKPPCFLERCVRQKRDGETYS